MAATPVPTTQSPTPAAASGAPFALERALATIGTDTHGLSVDEVRRHMRVARAAQAALDAWLLALDARMREIADNGESLVPVDPQRELCRHAGLRRREVTSLASQASAAAVAPQLRRLLAEGATTAAHLDAMGQALAIAGEGSDELLGHVDEIARRAVTATVDDFDRFVKRLARDAQPDEGLSRFEQQRRRTFCRIWNDADGMTRLSAAFDPERGAAIAGCLDRHVEALFHSGDRDHRDTTGLDISPEIDPNDHRRALAVHALCTRTPIGEGGDPLDTRPARAEVIVHVDLQTLRTGLHERGVCRTAHGADLPPHTVRRLACDADIVPVVLDGRSVPLDVGRARRLATVHQRRALEAVHDTCVVPDCDVGFTRCVIHHLNPWEQGGPTDLANLVPLCNAHHHAVHEGGWTMRLDPVTRHVDVAPPPGPPPHERRSRAA